jgi:hypothetical protein
VRGFHRGVSIQIVFQNVEKIVRQAVGTVAFTVFLDLGEHAAKCVRTDTQFPGNFFFQFTKTVQLS